MRQKHHTFALSVINGLILLSCNILQYVPHPFYRIGHAVPVFAVGFVVCIACYFGEWQGAVWGAISGICMDAMSAGSICFHTITLLTIGLIAGLLTTYLFNINFYSIGLICILASVGFYLANWLINFAFIGDNATYYLLTHALPSIPYTAIIGIIFMFLYNFISKRTAYRSK